MTARQAKGCLPCMRSAKMFSALMRGCVLTRKFGCRRMPKRPLQILGCTMRLGIRPVSLGHQGFSIATVGQTPADLARRISLMASPLSAALSVTLPAPSPAARRYSRRAPEPCLRAVCPIEGGAKWGRSRQRGVSLLGGHCSPIQ